MRAGFVIICLFICTKTNAQRNCLFAPYNFGHLSSLTTKPSALHAKNAVPPRDTFPGEIITIPVVVHILFSNQQYNISDEQVLSQLTVLNEDFRKLNADAVTVPEVFKSRAADVKIMFCLAQVDPNGRPRKGIVRKQTSIQSFFGDDAMKFSAAGGDDAWDTKKYLNIWVCNLFGRSLGYATMPGSQPDKDGVVINYDVFGTIGNIRAPFNKGRTATHEIAHWLGLKHIWGDANCGVDEVDDTPQQKSYNFNCPTFPHVSSCSPDNNGDMFMNFMDLVDDGCMSMFTYGQKKRMRSLFAINGIRNEMLNSYACDSTLATGAPLPDTIAVFQSQPAVSIFPNPVQNVLNLKPKNGFILDGSICILYNSTGMQLKKITVYGENASINMAEFSAGVYFLEIRKAKSKLMLKLVKL